VAGYGFNELRFEEIRYASGIHMLPHAHEQVFLDLCLRGNIEEHWRPQTFARGPLTLTFLPAGALHGTRFPEEVRTFQIVLPKAWMERIRQVAPLDDAPATYQHGLPIWIALRLYREFQCRDDLSPLALEGMLLELLAEMARHSTDTTENHPPRWLREARDYLHAHFAESFSVDAVATAVGVHPSHLMRAFRQHHRCTLGDYVRRLRIEYACQLVSGSDTPLAHIAHSAGFADQSHFNQAFKSYVGMTPTEFRRASGRSRSAHRSV
jgi:AraC family transcriptional regulator